MRPLVERDILAAYKLTAPTAIDLINEGREVLPQLFFLQMSKVQPGVLAKMRLFDPRTVLEAHRSPNGKQLLMILIKAALGTPGEWESVDLHGLLSRDGFTPHLAVHISEAWSVRRAKMDLDTVPSEAPDRAEVLVIGVHLREHSYSHFLPITTDAAGHRHCEMTDWKPHDTHGPLHVGGIFSIQQDEML